MSNSLVTLGKKEIAEVSGGGVWGMSWGKSTLYCGVVGLVPVIVGQVYRRGWVGAAGGLIVTIGGSILRRVLRLKKGDAGSESDNEELVVNPDDSSSKGGPEVSLQ